MTQVFDRILEIIAGAAFAASVLYLLFGHI
jgi:hypothetical protein